MDHTQKENIFRQHLTDDEVAGIESKVVEGLSSAELIDVFVSRGIRFSEATFRKYVQLGLLPRSKRVGTKGKHKGSKGIYPAAAVRQINEIKRMMASDLTIEEIRQQFVFLRGELGELRTNITRIVENLNSSLERDDRWAPASNDLRRKVAEVRDLAEALLTKIEWIANKIREQWQTAREAV